jgi:ElaB/YqjD/DUF883 family membrane-anchored ribosome-binding protein
MATTKTNPTETELREEFEELKAQVTSMADLLKQKAEEDKANLTSSIKQNFDEYSEKAKEQLAHAKELGSEGIEKVGGKVKENPFASLLIAFGAGYLISKAIKK